jgi:hypothetical protein
VAVCRLGPPGPACTLDAFTRFLAEIHEQGGVREVTDSRLLGLSWQEVAVAAVW